MSTRGWYEYYVVDDARKQVSLAIQFYKWGDATPANAISELIDLRAATRTLKGRVPVQHVVHLLRDNLGAAYEHLPESFPLGCYYFLLQRAAEELSPFRRRYYDLPKEERPDYALGRAVGLASVQKGFEVPRVGDPTIDMAHFSIEVGVLVRRWQEHSKEMNFLQWVQYITQDTKVIDMGSLAGDYEPPSRIDHTYRYRVFLRVPEVGAEDQRIDGIHLELLNSSGEPLLADPAHSDEHEELRELMTTANCEPVSLEALGKTHQILTSAFWRGELPRGDYLGP